MVIDMRSLVRLTVLATLLVGAAAARGQSQIPWVSDLEQAQQVAEGQHKLILIHFYNDHCPPCERVENEVFSQPRVVEAIVRNYVPVKVHAGAQPKVAEQFRVDRWPTDIICTPAWQEIMRTTSPQKPDAYIGMVDQIAMQTGVGTGRNWQTSMQAVGQTVLDSHVAQAQAVAGQAAGAVQGYAGQAGAAAQGYLDQSGTSAQGFANQSNSTFQGYADQANRWNQQAAGAAEQANNTALQAGNVAQQFGNTAQQMRSLLPSAGRDWQTAWNSGAAAAAPSTGAAPQGSAYAQFAQPNSQPAAQPQSAPPQVAQTPAAQPQLPPAALLPTANPFVGAAPSQSPAPNLAAAPSVAAPPQAAPTTSATIPPPSAAPNTAPGTAPPTAPMGALSGSPSPSLTRDQGLVPASQAPPVALEGYCVVTLLEQRKWQRSDPKYGAIHRGRTYLFASEAEQKKFLANPDGYSPMLSGFDPVIFSQRGELVEGKRSYGLTYNKQIFLFADEASLQAFSKSPHSYAEGARQAMIRANPASTFR